MGAQNNIERCDEATKGIIAYNILQVYKLREILERIRFNGGNLVIAQMSTDQKYEERRILAMLSDERASI